MGVWREEETEFRRDEETKFKRQEAMEFRGVGVVGSFGVDDLGIRPLGLYRVCAAFP
jgi:hypothetical protein